jgi:hypothetical protein
VLLLAGHGDALRLSTRDVFKRNASLDHDENRRAAPPASNPILLHRAFDV